MPARSFRIIFSATGACSAAALTSNDASDKPPALPRSLWQTAQDCLTVAASRSGACAAAAAGGCGRAETDKPKSVNAAAASVVFFMCRDYRFLTPVRLPRIVAGTAIHASREHWERQMKTVSRMLFCAVCLLAAARAGAQVQTGSIVGIVTDASGAVLPGATVSLSGERLIGGPQAQVTDSTGAYRFDRLPPGTYIVKFELQGFRTIEHADIRVNAAFVATVNAKLEVGSVTESITVTGESPTVDTKSNVQQTVMTQDIPECVPTGRDPWSLAKLIPGVQVATYDVGGTQSIP